MNNKPANKATRHRKQALKFNFRRLESRILGILTIKERYPDTCFGREGLVRLGIIRVNINHNEMEYRQIKVPEELHWELKKSAADKQLTLIQLLWEYLNQSKPRKKMGSISQNKKRS